MTHNTPPENTSEQVDIMYDFIEGVKGNIYNIRHAEISIQERDKLLREVDDNLSKLLREVKDDLSNLSYLLSKFSNTTIVMEPNTMTPNTQPTPQEQIAHDINRLREIRRTSRQLGYILDLPRDYNDQDIDHAACELSTIIEVHNEGVRI